MGRRTVNKYSLILLFLFIPSIVFSAPPTRTYDYVDGETIEPSEVKINEDNIYNYLSRGVDKYSNGSITTNDILDSTITTNDILDETISNSDISASAGIVDTKLATISTAGKVSGTALTGLTSIPSAAGVIPSANLTSVAQKGANSDITSLSGITTPLSIAQGGTGYTSTTHPAFLVRPASIQENVTIGTSVIVFGTEVFDQGDNFSSNIFTAPVTGIYSFAFSISLYNVDSAATNYAIRLVTDNRSYSSDFDPTKFSADVNLWSVSGSFITDMDINDTAYIAISQDAGAAQTDIYTISYFSGALLF